MSSGQGTLAVPAPASERVERSLLAPAAALITIVLWASAFVGIRDAGESLGAGPLALGRLAIGVAVLGIIVFARREPFPARRDLPLIALCGVFWFGVYNVALNASERHIDAGTASMLVNVGPILIAVLAGLLLREGFPRQLLIGIAIAFAGVAVIGVATSESGLSTIGTVLALLAAAAYAVSVIAYKVLLARVSPLQLTFLGCSIGVFVCLPFAPALVEDVSSADASALVWTAYLGVFPTAVAFTTWAYALARSDAGRLSALTYLVPPISIGLSWGLLGETPPVLAYAGGALCLLGVALSRRR